MIFVIIFYKGIFMITNTIESDHIYFNVKILKAERGNVHLKHEVV